MILLRHFVLTVMMLVMGAATAGAAPVTITPTTIVLGPGRNTALITITNESDGTARFETSLHTWQEAGGETKLEPTTDVVVFPQLITLQPREQKKVRVGTELAPGNAERSYRLILQEMPQFNRESGQVNIEVLSKISLPIFVTPTGVQPKAEVAGLNLQDGQLKFEVANTGGAHFVLRQVDVIGRSAAGQAFALNTRGWYVLSGGRQAFQVAISAADCRKASEILVRAVGDMGPADARIPVTQAACGALAQSQFQKIATNPAAPPS